MIQELYIFDVIPGASRTDVNSWLIKAAEVYKKNDLVVDAYGLRPETGNVSEFNKVYMVVVFESISDRAVYWSEADTCRFMEIQKENREKQLVQENWGHKYFQVIR